MKNIREIATRTIQLETESVAGLLNYINDDFEAVVKHLLSSQGRIVVSGIGKSAIIGQKMVATLNSTGTPALFMHAADAIHGDLGMIQPNDVVMILSRSGESPEIKVLVPLVKNFGNTVIAMVGNLSSTLAKKADFILNTTVHQEACPNNLAPTSSTTAQLVMGDALAVCLMELRGFSGNDFAKFHPGGMLGKQLYLKVEDLSMQNEKPAVLPQQNLRDVIVEISKKRLGATAVVNENNTLLGIITDGDLRRLLEKEANFQKLTAGEVYTSTPKTIQGKELAVEALRMMREFNVSQLVVLEQTQYQGMIHLHDLIREGLI
jgi:arabinose-5-phosphate isomerase